VKNYEENIKRSNIQIEEREDVQTHGTNNIFNIIIPGKFPNSWERNGHSDIGNKTFEKNFSTSYYSSNMKYTEKGNNTESCKREMPSQI
jgi:hypothetical protein